MNARNSRRKDYLNVVKRVKSIVRSIDPKAEVYVFGSFVRGEATAMSDIDVLVVTEMIESKYEMMVKVYKALEEPLELHVVTEQMLKKWYKRFIPAEELVKV
ncbi:MAG: nucleotidyltransferase domain-containing protein [Candidatus Nezhaarchaeales archaeon]